MTIADHVREAFANAAENGCHFTGWTDEEVRDDMIEYDADLEACDPDEVLAEVRNQRAASSV